MCQVMYCKTDYHCIKISYFRQWNIEIMLYDFNRRIILQNYLLWL